MLKDEPYGAPKKRPLGRPLIQGVFKKSSSPVQTAKSSQEIEGFFGFICFLSKSLRDEKFISSTSSSLSINFIEGIPVQTAKSSNFH